MFEDIMATTVGLARNEVIDYGQLMELTRTGTKKRIKRMPDATASPQQAAQPAMPQQPEVDTRTEWQKAGFHPAYETLVGHFEALRPSFVLPVDIRNLMDLTETATTVEAYAEYSDDQLVGMIDTVVNRLPRIQNDIETFVSTLGTVRPMIVEVDFI